MYGRKPRATEVVLNVYDLAPINDWVHPVGLGAYHSGIEINGREYTFAGGGGIFDHDPRKAPGAHFREAVMLGSFSGESGTLARALDTLRDDFGPDRYNVLTRNCNTFSSALCEELLGRPIPSYVNRLAWMGSWFSCLVPAGMLGDAPVNEGGAAGGFSMQAPPGRRAITGGGGRAGSNYSAFQGSGMSLAAGSSRASGSKPAGASGGREGELSDRRDRMRAAALRRAEAAATVSADASGGAGGGGSSMLKTS